MIVLIIMVVVILIIYYLWIFLRDTEVKKEREQQTSPNCSSNIMGESKFDNRQFWTKTDIGLSITKEADIVNTFVLEEGNEPVMLEEDLIEAEYEDGDSGVARGIRFEEIVYMIKEDESTGENTGMYDSVMKQIQENREKMGDMLDSIEIE